MGPLRAIKSYSGYNLHLGKSLHRYLLEVQRIFRTRITQHMLFSMDQGPCSRDHKYVVPFMHISCSTATCFGLFRTRCNC